MEELDYKQLHAEAQHKIYELEAENRWLERDKAGLREEIRILKQTISILRSLH